MNKEDANTKASFSWSKPAGVANLIGRKRVDWSVFEYGSTVPREFHDEFVEANGGEVLTRGESRDLRFLVDGDVFTGVLRNVRRADSEGETLEINYGVDGALRALLRERLAHSFGYLSSRRADLPAGREGHRIVVPADDAEYIDFLSTGEPFTYVLHFVTRSSMEQSAESIGDCLRQILDSYVASRDTQFRGSAPVAQAFDTLRSGLAQLDAVSERHTLAVKRSFGQGNWAHSPWVAFLDSRETVTTQRGTYVAYLFPEDMSGVYLTLTQGITDIGREFGSRRGEVLNERKQRLRDSFRHELAAAGFSLDDSIDLKATGTLSPNYERATAAYKFYPREHIPADEVLVEDLQQVLNVYDRYLLEDKTPVTVAQPGEESPRDYGAALEELLDHISGHGFTFEPWQVAAYFTALRTKPFVILAGISGTGKTQLPLLVAKATGGQYDLVPVRPDWTDSTDVLGYCDLQGNFQPGAVLRAARAAMEDPERYYVCILDEMNLARVEQYLAEVLSKMEDVDPAPAGGYISSKLLSIELGEADAEWANVCIPPNMGIVGTVNMDETTQGFSRKVLDRAFTLEFSDIDLTAVEGGSAAGPSSATWPPSLWFPRARRLSELAELTESQRAARDEAIAALVSVNEALKPAQLQVGYRTRDEVVLFCINAQEVGNCFVTGRSPGPSSVKPLDLAVSMKVLPRIIGGSNPIRDALLQLVGWALDISGRVDEAKANEVLADWVSQGRPSALSSSARFPRTAARLCLMWERLQGEGITSYWL